MRWTIAAVSLLSLLMLLFLSQDNVLAAPGNPEQSGKAAGGQAPEDSKPQPVTRVYDIRSLVAPIPNFPLATSPHGPAFSGESPPSQGGLGAMSAAPTTQPTGLTRARFSANALAPPTENDAADSIVRLIEDLVSPDTWRDNGGAVGVIRYMHGSLIVTQSATDQKAVADFLSQLGQDQGQVRITADWVAMPPDALAGLLKNAQGAAQADRVLQVVDSAALEKLGKNAARYHADLASFSGQTVHVVSGLERLLATSTTPIVSTGAVGYAPTVSNLGGGLALEINCRVDPDGKSALVTLSSTFTDPNQQISSEEKAIVAGPETAVVHTMEETVQELRTAVRIPVDMPIVVGGMTLGPGVDGADASQLILILKVTALKQ